MECRLLNQAVYVYKETLYYFIRKRYFILFIYFIIFYFYLDNRETIYTFKI